MTSTPRRGWLAAATALGVYAISAALVVFGLLENPRTWSFGWNVWLHRNLPFVLNCQDGWSTVAKLVPLALLGVGAGVASFVPGAKARALRWLAAPLALATVVVEAVTWPEPGCPPA